MDLKKGFNPETAKNTSHFKVGQFDTYIVDYESIQENVNEHEKTAILDDTQYIGPLVSSKLTLSQRSDRKNQNRFFYEGTMVLANSVDTASIQEEFFAEMQSTVDQIDEISMQSFYFNNNRMLVSEMERGRPAISRLGVYPKDNTITLCNEGFGTSTKFEEIQVTLRAPNLRDIEGYVSRHFSIHVVTYVAALNSLCTVLYGGIPEPQKLIITPDGPLYQDKDSEKYLKQQKYKKVILGAKNKEIEEKSEYDNDTKNDNQVQGKEITKGIVLDDIGGLESVRAKLKQVANSFKNAEAMKMRGVQRPNGIFMYGPPGTGKTTLATALANEINGSLWEIKVSDIKDKWHGNSERNMQEIFDKARKINSPTVMLFDEFETMINTADSSQSSSNTSDNAVAGIFKKEVTKLLDENENIILIAATNYDDRIDESLIRSGRFDMKLYVPMPDENARVQIFANKIADMISTLSSDGFSPFETGVDPTELAQVTESMSGADIDAILRKTAFNKAVQDGDKPGSSGPITQDDILQQINDFRTQ